MNTQNNPNVNIPPRFIIEIGLCRKRDVCALCNKQMDVPNHNIQLCSRCRMYELDKFHDENENKFTQSEVEELCGLSVDLYKELKKGRPE